MRVAALYDIHGNLPALEAVLAEVESEGVDLVVVGGDVVPGPMPSESLARLLDLTIPTRFIHGNGEHDIVALERGDPLERVPERFHDVMRWVHRELSPAQLDALSTWPLTTSLDIAGLGTVLFCHATPRDDNELFTDVTPAERLAPVFGTTGADLVVCGHTHMQFDRRVEGTRIVNAGSVGMPFGEPGAYWVLLGPHVHLRRTSYDLDTAARRIEGSGYPEVAAFDVREPPGADEMRAVFEAASLR